VTSPTTDTTTPLTPETWDDVAALVEASNGVRRDAKRSHVERTTLPAANAWTGQDVGHTCTVGVPVVSGALPCQCTNDGCGR
jgi:hypothetical protein